MLDTFDHHVDIGNTRMRVSFDGDTYIVGAPVGCIVAHADFRHQEWVKADGRYETEVEGVHFKCKLMPNGELRFAANIPRCGWYTVTVRPDWDLACGEPPWQTAHRHEAEGAVEHYYGHDGMAIFIRQDEGGEARIGVLRETSHTYFEPMVAHKFLPLPRTVFGTYKPDVGPDWYKAEDLLPSKFRGNISLNVIAEAGVDITAL